MGFLSDLFGQTEHKNSESENKQELRLEYNIMKNIKLEKCKKHENSEKYEFVENGIYLDLNDEDDAKYRMTLSYELESDETYNQYPLEDILDRYLMFVSDFLESENEPNSNKYIIVLGGYLEQMKKAKEILEKKVYNREYVDEEGQIRVKLVIE